MYFQNLQLQHDVKENLRRNLSDTFELSDAEVCKLVIAVFTRACLLQTIVTVKYQFEHVDGV